MTTIHFLAMAQVAAGHPAEARRLANALADAANSRYVCAYEVGTVFLRLGDTDKAVQWLHRGLDERCDCMVWLKTEPWMNPSAPILAMPRSSAGPASRTDLAALRVGPSSRSCDH